MATRRKRPWLINTSRVRLRRVNRRFARSTPAGALVLDAGAGHGPYRRLFSHARYEAADFAQLSTRYTPLDYVCTLTDIPVEDGRFARILCNQVLEHLDAPAEALAELYRVLAPGGRILLSAPLFYPEHQEPYDYFRYTQFALRTMFRDAGFTDVTVSWLEGYFGTVAFQLEQMHRQLPRARTLTLRRRVVLGPFLAVTRATAFVLSGVFARLDLRWKYTASGMPKNYVVRAAKADGGAGSAAV
ncbi:class I SAM-dependent methyltransferase [Mumia sp. zg.B53]|uniref:class I SAM-dependent methyltransferase n=1 Tax=unclassified Mumia TaxID=2621872 RepID=UPI001C6F1F2D|nr:MULTISPECIES: class I SAM-dependent methyltransferase [unclassified Mumia]MBW9211055.1 class I SAM-dependent methyltransferase [Mumia sp. zg.B21]MBW9215623.1 class I SAM-dependent methyltransferase [Mumia sp. zg.B53]